MSEGCQRCGKSSSMRLALCVGTQSCDMVASQRQCRCQVSELSREVLVNQEQLARRGHGVRRTTSGEWMCQTFVGRPSRMPYSKCWTVKYITPRSATCSHEGMGACVKRGKIHTGMPKCVSLDLIIKTCWLKLNSNVLMIGLCEKVDFDWGRC